jgi:DNA primase
MNDRGAEVSLVKERVSLREVVSEVVGDLKSRGGDDLWACCPFHNEDTPSFHIRPALGVYKCFGCGESGDVFSFIQKTRNIGFREALEMLADRAGVELGSLSPEDRRRQADAKRTRKVLEAAAALFLRGLGSSAGRSSLSYLRGRGFTDETLKAFDLGYIPTDFRRVLLDKGVPAAALDGAGFTGAFGGRIAFGIRDGHGALVGFGARRLEGNEDGPKYVNTRETPYFSKGRLLYGLDKAARALAQTRRLVVMEGYTDVMMAHQAGLHEVVATMGTSFTKEHMRLLKGRVSNLVLVFDGDEPGQQAAERAVRMTLEHGMECRVLLLPGETDPCDWFSAHSRDDFDAMLARGGLSTVAFLCRRGVDRLDPGQPGGRESVAREVTELSHSIEDPLRRESIATDIARACGIDRNLLRAEAAVAFAPAAPTGASSAASRGPTSAVRRSQYVAVAGLAEDSARLVVLDELTVAGAITETGVVRLLALARELLEASGGSLDAAGWLEAAREQTPELVAGLDRALMPPPDILLPSWEEAVEHLRQVSQAEAAREARRTALAQPDIESNGEVLRGVHTSLVADKAPRDVSVSGADPA